MFEWFKRKRIKKLAKRAGEYLEITYVKPKDSTVHYSVEDADENGLTSMHESDPDGNVQFQQWDSCGKAKYSVRDNYDSDMIQSTMRNLSSSTPATRILSELEQNTNMTFVDKMLEHIDKRHLKDSDVYKAAQVDRRLFSKIVSDRDYKPAKDTCVAFALALRLTLPEADDLLSRAGYTLSHSSKRDVVIEYFFKEHIYNLNDINEILYQLKQKIIGR